MAGKAGIMCVRSRRADQNCKRKDEKSRMETAEEKKNAVAFRVGIVTLSDKGYRGEREDKSGPKIR